MITAVIPLPNFTQAFLDNTDQLLGIDPIDGFDSGAASYSVGREFSLGVRRWFKYKLVMQDTFNDLKDQAKMFLSDPNACMSESEIVIVSSTEINLDNYDTHYSNVIYPIYGHCCGMTVLFTKSIERLLRTNDFYAAGEIISPLDFLSENYTLNTGHPPPDVFLTEGIELAKSGFSPADVDYSLEQMNNMVSGRIRDMENNVKLAALVNKFATINNIAVYPDTFLKVAHAVSWGEIQPYINEFLDKTDNVRNAVVASMKNWDEVCNKVVSSYALCIHPTNTYFMGKMIAMFLQQYDDFYFDVDMNDPHPTIPDTYVTHVYTDTQFNKSMPSVSPVAKDLLHLYLKCIGLGNGKKVRVHRSCMEDVSITDLETGDVYGYIDLVWWIMASSHGLIDRTYL